MSAPGEALPPPTPAAPPPRVVGAPRLTMARGELLREITILDEYGERRRIHIPAERAADPVRRPARAGHADDARRDAGTWLVLGYLLNQRLIQRVDEVESVTVDWGVSRPR
jgi:FdhD protein